MKKIIFASLIILSANSFCEVDKQKMKSFLSRSKFKILACTGSAITGIYAGMRLNNLYKAGLQFKDTRKIADLSLSSITLLVSAGIFFKNAYDIKNKVVPDQLPKIDEEFKK